MLSIMREILGHLFMNTVNTDNGPNDVKNWFRSEFKDQAQAAYDYYMSTGKCNYQM